MLAETLRTEVDALRSAPAYRNYEEVRERVLRMRELDNPDTASVTSPSDYWREELENFDYMLDASPLIVAKLRRHCYHITGLWHYHYRTGKDKLRAQFAEKLEALVELGGRKLLVPESPELGGFGFEIDGALYNLDTLKYYEVLVALKRGAVLDDLRRRAGRKIVLEIGAGWGGLAYQFTTVCPNTTYIIVDFPEVILFSGVYLGTLFPDARLAFYGTDPIEDDPAVWEDADFVFVPHTRLQAVSPPRLDLTMNTVSFQEMTTEQVEGYVHHVYELGCPYLYSLNRDRSLYNTQLTSVSRIVSQWYWPHPIEVLPVSYVHMLDSIPKISRAKRAKLRAKERARSVATGTTEDLDYRHIVGWRRLLT